VTEATEEDALVRSAAFAFLAEQTRMRGEVLPYRVLSEGFTWRGTRVPFLGPQGIFKPAVLPEMPLSITTAPEKRGRPRPYEDAVDADGLLLYRYQGIDPNYRDNVGLRLTMTRRTPLVYLFGIESGWYLPGWPAYVIRDEPSELTFTVALDDRQVAIASTTNESAVSEIRRSYVTRLTMQRVHQSTFRQRVLRAYRDRCAICRLRHEELLDAAHILPDSDPRGVPSVDNGLALCKLHHAAFDRHFVGIRPDLIVTVREDLLREEDGPMLLHGLKGFHGQKILVPGTSALRPNPEFLAVRFTAFTRAG
jgi:putative restriction endonuclease